MKRLGRIWPDVISFANLHSAYLKARKGKQSYYFPGDDLVILGRDKNLLHATRENIRVANAKIPFRFYS